MQIIHLNLNIDHNYILNNIETHDSKMNFRNKYPLQTNLRKNKIPMTNKNYLATKYHKTKFHPSCTHLQAYRN